MKKTTKDNPAISNFVKLRSLTLKPAYAINVTFSYKLTFISLSYIIINNFNNNNNKLRQVRKNLKTSKANKQKKDDVTNLRSYFNVFNIKMLFG